MHAMAASGMGGMGGEEVLLKRRMAKSKIKRRPIASAAAGGGGGVKNRFTERIGIDHGPRSGRADYYYMGTYYSDDDHGGEDGSGPARRADVVAMYDEITRYETPFTKALATEDARQMMEPFLHIDIDEERKMLGDEEAIKRLKLRESLMRAKTVCGWGC